MALKLPIGISDFKKLRDEGCTYIDKTLFIDELQKTRGEVILIPRPRRFGKTLNLSMLQYFFEKTEVDNSYLFKGTSIWELEKYRELQGSFPVIFISFKSCKDNSWDIVYKTLVKVISKEFSRHLKEVEPVFTDIERRDYIEILDRSASYTQYTESLLFLSELLQRVHNKNVIVLIDEYDAPIHAAYTHGFYEPMVAFMRSLLTDVFKDNKVLKRGVLTGILRAAKEGIFSGLNNLRVFTLLDKKFQDKFGFTVQEVEYLLKEARLEKKGDAIKQWYNGYRSGSTLIYNPWSLLECIDNKGLLDPYWANTSDNALVKRLIAQADDVVKSDLEELLKGSSIVKEIDGALIFPGIEQNNKALWSLLLFAGYLTFKSSVRKDGIVLYTLILPNEEIKLLYRQLIKSIFEESLGASTMRHLADALDSLDGERLNEMLQKFVLRSMSTFDITDKEPEISYHMFVLGLLVVLSDTYEVNSNKESGYGRYDILLIPKNKKKRGIVIEFKKVTTSDKTLEVAANRALGQIVHKNYAQVLKDRGITSVGAFGIACKGKKVLVKTAVLD